MFPEGAPTELLAVVIDEAARTSKWEVLGSLYEQYASKINSDGDAACSMAMAQFRSGNPEAALARQHRAEERGCKRVGDLSATISGMNAIGMAADVLNGRVSLSRGNSSVELNGVRVSTSQVGSSVQLSLVYRHADLDSTIFGSECFISTKSNRKIKSGTLGFVDVARYSSTPLQLSFDVPAGEVVESLVIPTGLKFTNSGAPIVVTLPLGPDQQDRLDGLPDGKIVTANELLHLIGIDVSLEDLHTWTGLSLRNGDAPVAITSELRAAVAKGLSGRTASAAILPK